MGIFAVGVSRSYGTDQAASKKKKNPPTAELPGEGLWGPGRMDQIVPPPALSTTTFTFAS
jgi:hypothetical protein